MSWSYKLSAPLHSEGILRTSRLKHKAFRPSLHKTVQTIEGNDLSMVKSAKKRAVVYYAHAMCVYGTPCERAEIALIRECLPKTRLVNPARYSGHPEKLADTMGFCLNLINGCDIVVFAKILGRVTAGVGKEVNYALQRGKMVYELTKEGLVRRHRRIKYVTRQRSIKLYDRWWTVRGGNPW
jgi:hypothetical protein